MDKKSHVQGLALYLEYEKPYDTGFYVQQVLITPDGFNSAGALVQSHVFRRRMRPGEGKKQWKVTATSDKLMVDSLSGAVEELDFSVVGKKAYMRMEYTTPLFDAITSQHFTLRLKPLVMEVSQIDLDDITRGKTPYKLMYRMQQCRLKAGFPADAIPAA